MELQMSKTGDHEITLFKLVTENIISPILNQIKLQFFNSEQYDLQIKFKTNKQTIYLKMALVCSCVMFKYLLYSLMEVNIVKVTLKTQKMCF